MRLRKLREQMELKQSEIAEILGIGTERWKSYEDGRARLPWEIAARLGSCLAVNPRHLARNDCHPFAPFDVGVLKLPIPPRMPFLEAFAKNSEAHLSIPPKLKDNDGRWLRSAVENLQHELVTLAGTEPKARLQVMLQPWFLVRMMGLRAQCALLISQRHALPTQPKDSSSSSDSMETKEGADSSVEDNCEKDLRLTSKADLITDMATAQQELESLLAKVRGKTANRGMQKKLADAIGVKPQRVSDWLSGTKVPDGINLLRLQKWVGKSQ